MSANPIVATENLTKRYQMGGGSVWALRGVSITVNAGEFLALMGPSGSGKSSLLHLLGCLDTPTGGSYHLLGQDVGRLNSDARARRRNESIGFIFQTFNLLPRLTAVENVFLPLLLRRISRAAATKRAREMLVRVGLGDRTDHRPDQLSGGQRQRVAIARALVTDPPLLLADEPTGNLDSATGHAIMTLLESLHADGKTILLVTHDEVVADFAGRRLLMFDGKLADRLLTTAAEPADVLV